MPLEQFLGLPRGRYLPNPVSEHPFVIEKLEGGVLYIPRFFVGQDGDTITAIADDQIVFEATVKIPSGIGEAPLEFFYPLEEAWD
jgi:hypothetical protein